MGLGHSFESERFALSLTRLVCDGSVFNLEGVSRKNITLIGSFIFYCRFDAYEMVEACNGS
jgi:hypothetical protein